MRRRLRSLIGSMLILVFVPCYALIAMALAESRIRETPIVVQTIAYLILGLAWVLPVMPVMRWMARPDPEEV